MKTHACVLVLVTGLLALASSAYAQTLYSRKTGNWDDNSGTGTWSTTGHGGSSCSCTPGAANTVVIGSSHTVTYRSGTPASTTVTGIIVNDDGGGGTLTFGNAAASVTTLTVTGDVTINTGGTFSSNAGAANHTLVIGGNLTNNNSFNFGTNTTVTFNGSATSTISGSGGTFNFQNFILNTSSAANVAVTSGITINGTLTFSANGHLQVDASSNITLGSAASISGANSNRYIELDGESGANSQLIKTNAGTTASWSILFPIGTANAYTPLDLTTANGATVSTAPVNGSKLGVKAIYKSSVQGEMRRVFRLSVTGNTNATTFQNADFYYSSGNDVSQGDVLANYSTIWYLNFATGSWASVNGTAPGGSGFFSASSTAQSLATGTYYYTLGTSTAYPNTWYSYQTGSWSDPDIWTMDPSGTTLVNPLTQSPLDGDEVVVLNGFTVTVDVNTITNGTTTIEGGGTLDIASTTGHNLGILYGSGLLRINGTTLPSGTYTSFVSTSGGTIEYYNTSGTLSTTQTTYNKLKFTNSSNSAAVFTTASNMTVVGTLDITQTAGSGTVTWMINNTANTSRTITVAGDVTISASGQIRAGTGNSGSTTSHNLTLSGNFINNGSVKFFDDTDAALSDANYTGGNVYTAGRRGNSVAVTFSGVADATITCNNTTDFYKLILDKGTGQQSMLTVTSTSAANFRLFGPNNQGSNTGTAPNEISDNALQLKNGTLQLAGTITIPRLASNGSTGNDYFSIPQNAGLWINSPNVSVTVASSATSNDDQRIMLDGLLRVSSGTLHFGDSKGLGSGSAGVFLLEGGTVTTWQFRARAGGTGIFAYKQTGGTFNVGYTYGLDGGVDGGSDARFDLSSASSSFQMNGGVINIGRPTSVGGNGIYIACSSSNYNVTGGTINVYTGPVRSGTENTFNINSTVPFYNLTINRESGTSVARLLTSGLTILNDLTLVSTGSPTFQCNALALTIGGNFDMQTGTTFTPGNNTITFNGTAAQAWTHNASTFSGLYNVVINKTSGTLTLGGTGTFPTITNGLTLTAGTLNDGGKTITVSGSISNSAIHTGTGNITVTAATTIGGSNGTFGNLTIQTNNNVATSGDQTVTGNLRLTSASTSLNIASYALTVNGNIYSDGTTGTSFSASKRIYTSGLHNAGGLTRQGASGDLLFPVGNSGTAYTPITINVAATTHGTITVRPVTGEHPNVTTSGASMQFYWRVTSAGYSGITAVNHKSYSLTPTKSGTTSNYVAARYDATANSWGYSTATFNAGALSAIPDFNTATSWTGVTGTKLDGEYTCGENTSFGTILVYYSRQSGAWNLASTWSNVGVGNASAASSMPCNACPVVIGDGTSINHTITIDADARKCGTLQLNTGSTLDCGTRVNLNFGANTGGTVTGRGTLRIAATGSPAAFPNGDFTNFVGPNGGTVEWYGNTKTLPTSGPSPQNINLTTYYNLIINPSSGQTITLPNSSITVYNDLTLSGAGTTNTNTGGIQNITVNGNLAVNAGTFSIRNGNVVNFAITGNTTVASGASFSVQTGGTRTHTFSTQGGITNNGTITFNGTTAERVDITFTGTSNVSFTGTNAGASTALGNIIVNKGTSQSPTVTFDVAGTVSTPATGWLTLTNGTFSFSNSNAYTLSTASAAYSIPATAALKVTAGTVTVLSAGSDAADLSLTGKLEVTGGTVNIGTSGNNNNNDIEYASAGTPTIAVSGGTLYINGAVRRSTSTISGGLVYNQTGGTVTVGGRNTTSNNSRGVFEIDYNLGSSFTLSGNGKLQVLRPNGGSNYADVFINPITSAVSSTSTIEIGLNTGTAQSFKMNIAPSVGKLSVIAGGTGAQTVTMYSNPLIVTGDLTVESNGTLATNSLNVSVAGDMSLTGVYNGAANTTTFNGSTGQLATLSSGSSFQNITINNSGNATIALSGTSPSITNLNILLGTLDVGSLGLTVNGDIVNNSNQIGSGSITISGSSTLHSITSSNGSFTNLTLGGAATTKTVKLTGDLSINGTLTFSTSNRFFSIGDALLTLGSAATVSGAGSTAFIRTNGVSSDQGVRRYWTGAGTFNYAVGTLTNYTPVSVTLNVTTPGYLTVIPVNERHPTYNVASLEQILNYYWIVTRDGTLNYTATGSHVYSYPSGLLGGAGGSLVAGYLDINNPTGWITSGHGGTATTTTMTYTNLLTTNLPSASNTYHLSCGTVNTLPNPIVPVYSRLSNPDVVDLNTGANWNDPTAWTTASNGLGAALSSAPYGVPVVILNGARINLNVNARIAFTSQIDGLVVNTNKVGHNLGIMSGTGTLRVSTNTLPAGNFTKFVSATGGTIEYVGPMTMNSRITYCNVSIIGSGTVSMTNSDLTLNGGLTIGSGVTLDNAFNRNMTIAKNITNNGTFNAGTSTITLNGTTDQTISGSTTFNNLVVNKTSGNAVLGGTANTTVNNVLTLTSGHVVASDTHPLTLGSTATISGGSATSYISGTVIKPIAASGSFAFPLGSVTASRYRPAQLSNTGATDTWTLKYVGNTPGTDGYDQTVFNTAELGKVSAFEYWLISRAGSASANVTLTYNTGSYIPPNIGTVANLRLVHWDGTQWDLAGSNPSQSGDNITGTVTMENVSSFSPITFGSLDVTSPLPIVLLYFRGERASTDVQLTWKTAQEINNERFELERSRDGLTYTRIASINGKGTTHTATTYQYTDTEASPEFGYYYRLKQVDTDGTFEYSRPVFVNAETNTHRWAVYPNPMNQVVTLEESDAMRSGATVTITIISSSGVEVYHNKGTLKSLTADIQERMKSVNTGIYLIRIADESYSELHRIAKQ